MTTDFDHLRGDKPDVYAIRARDVRRAGRAGWDFAGSFPWFLFGAFAVSTLGIILAVLCTVN